MYGSAYEQGEGISWDDPTFMRLTILGIVAAVFINCLDGRFLSILCIFPTFLVNQLKIFPQQLLLNHLYSQ